MAKKIKIRVLFKGGQTQEFECDKFSTKRNIHGELTEVTWENLNPSSLYLRLEDISAILESK